MSKLRADPCRIGFAAQRAPLDPAHPALRVGKLFEIVLMSRRRNRHQHAHRLFADMLFILAFQHAEELLLRPVNMPPGAQACEDGIGAHVTLH